MAKDKEGDEAVPLKIVKPESFLEKFRSKRPPTIAGVETLLTALPLLRIADANDFVRLHPSEEDYWSPRAVLRVRPDQGREARHAAPDRRGDRGAVPARRRRSSGSGWRWRRSPTTSSSSASYRRRTWTTRGTQRRSRPARKPRRCGCRRPRARRRASRATRSSTRATRMPFPIRNGRRARSRSCSRSRFATPTSTPTIIPALLRLIGAKPDLDVMPRETLLSHHRRRRFRIRDRRRRSPARALHGGLRAGCEISGTSTPSGSGAASSARHRHSISAPTRWSSATACGPR